MVINRKNKIILCLVAMLACLFAASSAFAVQAEDAVIDSATEIAELRDGKKADVASSQIFIGEKNSGDVFVDFCNVSLGNADSYVAVVRAIVDMADKRNAAIALRDGADPMDIEADSNGEAVVLAKTFLEASEVNSGKMNPTEYESVYQNVLTAFGEFETNLDAIRKRDELEFEDYRTNKAKEVGAEYERLIENTDTSYDRRGNQKVGAYSSEQLKKLDSVLADYAYKTADEYLVAEDGKLAQTEYSASDVNAKRRELDQIAAEGIKQLDLVKKNILEVVHSEWLEYVAVNDKYAAAEPGSEKDELGKLRDDLLSALKAGSYSRVREAVAFYEGASQEVKTKYSADEENLKKFMEENPPLILPEPVSSISDDNGVATITAYFDTYTSGVPEEAKVFSSRSDGGRLEIFASANGAKKRIANGQIKELNGVFSVAYFINFTVYESTYRRLELPETAIKYNADGTKKTTYSGSYETGSVYYRVELDLNKYFEKYCKERGYESDKLANVENAFSACKDGDSALCYTYKDAKIEKTYVPNSKQTELEGGKLVFYAKSFNDFCIAGTGLENWLTNPWTWVMALVALILLIIIIKIIVKNFKYRIKFVSNGGTLVRSLRVAKNEAIILPANPTKTGLVFAGWYTDEACTVRFIETKLRRRKGYKLYAKWAAPVSAEMLTSFYDGLRTLMVSYEKSSFKPTLGMSEKELIANMFGEENYIVLYLGVKFAKAKELPGGECAVSHKDKKFAALPTKVIVSDGKSYVDAIKLTEQVMIEKGLQRKEVAPEKVVSTPEERAAGFAYYVKNERVAASMADYFELLRIGLKSYVLETDNGKFKPGDRFTFARIYYTAKNVDLYMPIVKGIKELEKGERTPRFADTPVHIVICDNGDMDKAFELIEKAMLSYGFTKYPENSNDLEDIVLSDTDGFAYTIRF